MPFCTINKPGQEPTAHSITIQGRFAHDGKNEVQKATYLGNDRKLSIAFVKKTTPAIAITDAVAHVIAAKVAEGEIIVPTIFMADSETLVSLNACAEKEQLEQSTDYYFDEKISRCLINAGFGIAEALRIALADEDGAGNTQFIMEKKDRKIVSAKIVAMDFEHANYRKVNEEDDSAQRALSEITPESLKSLPFLISEDDSMPFLPHEGPEGFREQLTKMQKAKDPAAEKYEEDYLNALFRFCELMQRPTILEEVLAALNLSAADIADLPQFEAALGAFKARAIKIERALTAAPIPEVDLERLELNSTPAAGAGPSPSPVSMPESAPSPSPSGAAFFMTLFGNSPAPSPAPSPAGPSDKKQPAGAAPQEFSFRPFSSGKK